MGYSTLCGQSIWELMLTNSVYNKHFQYQNYCILFTYCMIRKNFEKIEGTISCSTLNSAIFEAHSNHAYTGAAEKVNLNTLNPGLISIRSIQSRSLSRKRVYKILECFFPIVQIERSGRHILISCTNGKYKTRQTLQELEKYLGKMFFRSHKSIIISTDRIER